MLDLFQSLPFLIITGGNWWISGANLPIGESLGLCYQPGGWNYKFEKTFLFPAPCFLVIFSNFQSKLIKVIANKNIFIVNLR